jgi:replication-associated recombination protein RarA
MFDPWTRVRTLHDLPADEVISALQKEIRRGNEENAALLAIEMASTSRELEQKLWDRLAVIAVEDVGFGDVSAPVLIDSLARLRERFAPGEGDRIVFAVHAARYLSRQRKDRSSDELLNWARRMDIAPEIPDYAIDMHTARGQAEGRDFEHFLEVGAQVAPELAGRVLRYRERLLAAMAASRRS